MNETISKEFVICPHCGYEDYNVYEYESGKQECVACGKGFRLVIDTVTTYTTTAID